MMQKKVCMLGAFAVGKTSLVSRFVKSVFSEKYHTTVGVKIDKKTVSAGGREASLILWDLYGEDDFQKVRMSYLRGSAGCLLVVDGTRRATLETAVALRRSVEESVGDIPFVAVLNKSDLHSAWELDPHRVAELTAAGWRFVTASAKTGEGVETAFRLLTEDILRD
jgi:small GTP-binding protein